MSATAVLHLRSLGQLTADVQRPYAALAGAVERLGLAPAVTIDGISYFDGKAVERITEVVTGHDAAQPPAFAPRRVRSRRAADDTPTTADAPRGQRRARTAAR